MSRALCPVNFLYKAPSFNLNLTWIVDSELYKLCNFTKINDRPLVLYVTLNWPGC